MNAQTEKYFEPAREINALTLENMEKLLDIQLKVINDTARVSVEQMKAIADIKDPDSLKKYFADQAETVKTLHERFVKDTQATLELGASYTDKVRRVMTDTVKPDAARKTAPRANKQPLD